jgi:hypothetical protein
MSYERLVEGYLAHANAVAHKRKDTHFWAYEDLHRLAEEKPDAAWPLVLAVVKGATDDQMLEYISADILEDIICDHAEALIERIEVLALADDHFKRALSNVWGWARMPVEVRTRLDVLVGREPEPSEGAG